LQLLAVSALLNPIAKQPLQQTMAYFYLDQLLYPSESASASQRGRKRCGPGGDMCDKKRAARRAHWEAHFAANGPHGPWGRHHHDHHHPHHGHWDGAQASRAMPIDFVEVRCRTGPACLDACLASQLRTPSRHAGCF
jgi:hypothetical protein